MSAVAEKKKMECLDARLPNGRTKKFYVTGLTPDGRQRGQVNVNGRTVSGWVKKVGRGIVFCPSSDSRHIHLVRPEASPIGTYVAINQAEHPYQGKRGTVIGLQWDYLTPRYSVKLDDGRFKLAVDCTSVQAI